MDILLTTVGSHGDIHPFIAIARALRERGHRTVILANPYFQAQIEASGAGFEPLGERQELRKVIAESRVMHPWLGPRAVLKTLVLPQVPTFLARGREVIRSLRPAAVVYHPIVIGVPWICRLEGVPAASISPSPLVWLNTNDQMIFSPIRSHNPSPLAVKADVLFGRMFMRLLLDGPLNRLRTDLGLARERDLFYRGITDGDVNLGVWSPLVRPPLPGDPPRSVITGFCWHDRDHTQEAADVELRSFLESGPPPVVFALGSTGVHAAGRFYERAVEVCGRLGVRGLLVVGRDQPPPRNLPDGGKGAIKAVAYAPFSTVFPRAAAVVHHGGAGTMAQGLRAGRPTVITPMAHDQFDNAARVMRLGTGLTVRFSRASADRLERALRTVLTEPSFARAAATLRPRLVEEDGAGAAAEQIERIARRDVDAAARHETAGAGAGR